MKVRDTATKEVYCAEPSSNLGEVAAMMKRHNVGAIPVCENDKLLGMITDRDLVISCMAADMEPQKCEAREFMTASPVSVEPDTDLEEAMAIMGKEQLHRLPVVDEGKLVGIISLGDACSAVEDDKLVAETLRKISTPT